MWRSLVSRMVRDHEAAGSSPATPTTKRMRSLRGAVFFFSSKRDLNGSGSEWAVGDSPEPRPGLRRSGGQVPPLRPSSSRTSYRSQRRFLFESKRRLSLTPSLLLSRSNPLRRASIWFGVRMSLDFTRIIKRTALSGDGPLFCFCLRDLDTRLSGAQRRSICRAAQPARSQENTHSGCTPVVISLFFSFGCTGITYSGIPVACSPLFGYTMDRKG